MKKWAILAALIFVLALVLLPDPIPGWKQPEGLTLSQSFQIQQDLRVAINLSGDRDGVELSLIHEGFSVENTDPNYPSYVVNGDPLRAFASGQADSCSLFQVGEGDRIFHLYFTKELLVLTTLTGGRVAEQELLPLYEAVLSDEDVFYYRCYPAGDPHYIDYSYFRLKPPNKALYDLTIAYILPVGYQMVNLFLTDWQEGNWGQVSLSDTFEYLYELETGARFPWQDLIQQRPGWYEIDADLFETTILPYFALTLPELRALCRYEEASHTYPWRPVEGNDMIGLEHEVCLPEVVEAAENPDGTLTLTVRVGCPDQKTDNRFTHQLTIRPSANGFQYVANQVTYVSDLGLPPSIARFDLGTY